MQTPFQLGGASLKFSTAVHNLLRRLEGGASYGSGDEDVRRRRPAQELRRAVDCLPVGTRTAMLDGLGANRIIVGAYVDRQGGVCPMLAAHRNGGRTNLASFAHAWDRYTKAGRGPRPATEREVRTLRTMLEASIALDDGEAAGPLGDAIADHKRSIASRPERRDTGERDRTSELHKRHHWSWMRPFRRYDEYAEALEDLGELERVPGPDELELGDDAGRARREQETHARR
jgi:hypothetical protein